MKLSDYIKQNPSATRQDAIELSETIEKMLSPDAVVSLLTEYDSVLSLQNKALTDDKAAGFLLALNGSVKEYNVMNSHAIGAKQQLLLSYLVFIGAVTEDFKNEIIKEANKVTYPFADITKEQLDACKLAYSGLTTHELDWDGRKTHLKITLHEDLYEAVNLTTFYADAIYTTPENLGRPKRVHKAGEYIIDLTNARKTGKLYVNFNIKANADCELI
jgi:hypothetical protein